MTFEALEPGRQAGDGGELVQILLGDESNEDKISARLRVLLGIGDA